MLLALSNFPFPSNSFHLWRPFEGYEIDSTMFLPIVCQQRERIENIQWWAPLHFRLRSWNNNCLYSTINRRLLQQAKSVGSELWIHEYTKTRKHDTVEEKRNGESTLFQWSSKLVMAKLHFLTTSTHLVSQTYIARWQIQDAGLSATISDVSGSDASLHGSARC